MKVVSCKQRPAIADTAVADHAPKQLSIMTQQPDGNSSNCHTGLTANASNEDRPQQQPTDEWNFDTYDIIDVPLIPPTRFVTKTIVRQRTKTVEIKLLKNIPTAFRPSSGFMSRLSQKKVQQNLKCE